METNRLRPEDKVEVILSSLRDPIDEADAAGVLVHVSVAEHILARHVHAS